MKQHALPKTLIRNEERVPACVTMARANQITTQQSTSLVDALEEPAANTKTCADNLIHSSAPLYSTHPFEGSQADSELGTRRWLRAVVAVSALCSRQYLSKICSIIAVVTTCLQNHIPIKIFASQYAWRCACVDERR